MTSELPGMHVYHDALRVLAGYVGRMGRRVADRIVVEGKLSRPALEREQHVAHGYAWAATYIAALEAVLDWAESLDEASGLDEQERLVTAIGFSEYANAIVSGMTMSQDEVVRPVDFGLDDAAADVRRHESVAACIAAGASRALRRELVDILTARPSDATRGKLGLPEMLEEIRDQITRFTNDRIQPHADHWHAENLLIPDETVSQMADLGVFGITIPEQYGGLGMDAVAMCVVSEELSRGYLGAGSLGTRSEIAAELIRSGGTEAQKTRFLPGIASGAILPTAVFTEPDYGSDLANLSTRAERGNGQYRITGNKTWITHASRAGLMTLLARSGDRDSGYRGLSMFLVEKPAGTDAEPFPVRGLDGTEIEVIGYRGMREYELAFDGFNVPADALLGGEEGKGFKQLMATFEAARIQTAARSIGVSQSAVELALEYAMHRRQFGKMLLDFPRVHGKIAWMVVELAIVRQLTYAAARRRSEGHRSDVPAGMAKLLAARAAWSAADNGLQIHGGNGYAVEYPISRILCDARILSIFEGAAEVQADIIVRGLLKQAATAA